MVSARKLSDVNWAVLEYHEPLSAVGLREVWCAGCAAAPGAPFTSRSINYLRRAACLGVVLGA